MKIALVTPHPTPLVLGGAENLWWGLQDHFQNHTDHQCDIVSVMAPESNFWELISSYQTFSKLDLSAYDCVISGKYPAWMVDHPNHICYMLHRLRGLYDTYSTSQHTADILETPRLRNFADWLQNGINNPEPDQIPELFQRLQTLRDSDVSVEVFAFPGPLCRAVIHFLDNAALAPSRIKRYAAISKTIAKRKDYFPKDAVVEVLYPPPHLNNYQCAESEYFFTSSRLDHPKRIDLLIKAMKLVKENISLLIAGTGPQARELEALAEDDPRIRFLGYVPDEQMFDLYANARAVPFIPMDEDYGLITIEAMKSSKPVLTVSDSGGPCEFVAHEETGYICKPTPVEIAKYLTKFTVNADEAKKMGKASFQKVASVTWDRVAHGLLDQSTPSIVSKNAIRPKLTVTTTFKVYPPMNGGQSRVFHLYRNLAKFFDIDIISLGATTDEHSEIEIAPGVLEIVIPKTPKHANAERQISQQVGDRPVEDITSNQLLDLTPNYRDALELSAILSDAVIACHPYTINTIRKACPDKPLWYEAQDVEFTLKSEIFKDEENAIPLLEEVKQAESKCWRDAIRVFACAQRDLDHLEQLYGSSCAFLHEVPNGVSLEDVAYTSLEERRRLKETAGISSQQVAIFIGSWHGPNLEAVEDIICAAPDSPQTRFIVIGSVCIPFESRTIPDNVEIMGTVDMEVRDLMLSIADVALNPMRLGTGTNLKMLDYMAAGIPVISSKFGARGLLIEHDKHYICAETNELANALAKLACMEEKNLETLIISARTLMEKEYSWQIIAERFAEEICGHLNDNK